MISSCRLHKFHCFALTTSLIFQWIKWLETSRDKTEVSNPFVCCQWLPINVAQRHLGASILSEGLYLWLRPAAMSQSGVCSLGQAVAWNSLPD